MALSAENDPLDLFRTGSLAVATNACTRGVTLTELAVMEPEGLTCSLVQDAKVIAPTMVRPRAMWAERLALKRLVGWSVHGCMNLEDEGNANYPRLELRVEKRI